MRVFLYFFILREFFNWLWLSPPHVLLFSSCSNAVETTRDEFDYEFRNVTHFAIDLMICDLSLERDAANPYKKQFWFVSLWIFWRVLDCVSQQEPQTVAFNMKSSRFAEAMDCSRGFSSSDYPTWVRVLKMKGTIVQDELEKPGGQTSVMLANGGNVSVVSLSPWILILYSQNANQVTSYSAC